MSESLGSSANEFVPVNAPPTWALSCLRDLAKKGPHSFVDGPFGSDLKNEEYEDSGVPLIQLNNIRVGAHDLSQLRFISEAKASALAKHIASPGDVVIAKMADPVARAAIVVDDFPRYVIVADCIRLSVDQDKAEPRFVVYAINSAYVRAAAESRSVGTGRIRTNLGTVRKLRLLLPPRSEQKRIASFLDRKTTAIDELIKKKERLIELLQEQRQAIITQAVTKGLDPTAPMKDAELGWVGSCPQHWRTAKLSHFARVLNGSTPDRSRPDYWDEGSVPWLSSGKVNDFIVTEADQFITDLALKECSVSLVPRGAVLVGMIGEGKTRGMSAYLDISACINQNVAAVIPNGELDGHFLHAIFVAAYEELRILGRGGQQDALNCQILGSFRFPLPPLTEQRRISERIRLATSAIDRVTGFAQRHIGLLLEYRQALISSAVTGQTDLSKEAA